MFMMRFVPVALTGLLFASHPVLAEETAAQPDQGGSAVESSVAAVETVQSQETAAPSGGMQMGGPGMVMGEQRGAENNQVMAMQPGAMGPGNAGCRMGMGGMKGMMPGAMGKGGMGKDCKSGCCMGRSGISGKQYRELMGRLDVLDARMAKIDAMLERLLER